VVIARPVAEIVDEISALESVGVRQFWLGCSELNVPNASHAIAVLTALAGRDLDLQVFLQPAPVNDALLDALEGVGIDPTSLSFEFGHLDDGILRAGGGPANLRHIEQLVELWQRRGYRQLGGSILLGSHPLETEATINSALEFALAIDGVFPDGFGLAYACGGRVYPETKLADHIAENWVACRPHLYTLGGEEPDPAFVRPVVHCRPMSPRLLMTRVRTTLVHARGNMGPMNTEAPAGLDRLSAERDVNLGIWRIQEDQFHDAETAFVAALGHQPGHLEALAQLSMLRANRLNDSVGARWALNRLATLLPLTDPRQEEIARALRQLS